MALKGEGSALHFNFNADSNIPIDEKVKRMEAI